MILEHTGLDEENKLDLNDVELDDGIVGDASELIEMAIDSQADVHNLTVALARLEHRCIVENAGAEVLEEGVSEFFKRAKDTIVKYWKKFVAWLMSTYTRIRDAIFGPREEWLKKNEKELVKYGHFNDVEVKVGEKVKGAKMAPYAGSADKLQVGALCQGYATSNQKREDLKKKLETTLLAGKSKDKSFAAALEEECIGAEHTVKIDGGLVKSMLAVAKETYSAAETFPHVRKIADQAIKLAEAVAAKSVDGAEGKPAKKIASRQVEALNTIGPVVQGYMAALISVNSRVNGAAMGVLVKALAAGRSAKAEGKKAPKNEGVSALDAFIS